MPAIGTGRIETYESPTLARNGAGCAGRKDLTSAGPLMGCIEAPAITITGAKSGPFSLVPAVIMSVRAKPALVEEALRAGAHQVLVLPTTASTLYRRLDWIINDDRPFELRGDMLAGIEERLSLSFQRPVYVPAGHPKLPSYSMSFHERGRGLAGKPRRGQVGARCAALGALDRGATFGP